MIPEGASYSNYEILTERALVILGSFPEAIPEEEDPLRLGVLFRDIVDTIELKHAELDPKDADEAIVKVAERQIGKLSRRLTDLAGFPLRNEVVLVGREVWMKERLDRYLALWQLYKPSLPIESPRDGRIWVFEGADKPRSYELATRLVEWVRKLSPQFAPPVPAVVEPLPCSKTQVAARRAIMAFAAAVHIHSHRRLDEEEADATEWVTQLVRPEEISSDEELVWRKAIEKIITVKMEEYSEHLRTRIDEFEQRAAEREKDVQEEIERCTKQEDELRARADSHKEGLNGLADHLGTSKIKLRGLKEAARRTRRENAKLNKQNEQITLQFAGSQGLIAQCQGEIQSLEKALVREHEKEVENAELQRRNQQLAQELHRLEELKAESQWQINTLESAARQQEEKGREVAQELHRLEEFIPQHQRQIEKVQMAVGKEQERRKEFAQENYRLQELIAQNQRQTENLQTVARKEQERKKEFAEESHRLEKLKAQNQGQIQTLERAARQQEERGRELTQELHQLQEFMPQHQRQMERLEKALAKEQERRKKFAQENYRLQELIAQHQRQTENLQTVARKEQERKKEFAQESRRLEELAQEHRRIVGDMKRKLDAEQRSLAEREQRLNEVREQLKGDQQELKSAFEVLHRVECALLEAKEVQRCFPEQLKELSKLRQELEGEFSRLHSKSERLCSSEQLNEFCKLWQELEGDFSTLRRLRSKSERLWNDS